MYNIGMLKDKGLIIGIIATVILIAGGVFLMSRGSTGTAPGNGTKINSEILSPQGAYVTGGIANGSYLAASSSAKITLVEFGDYQCPACIEYHPLVKQLLSEYAGQINYVFRNFPLSQHVNAPASAYAAEAAGLQGKYWQMHDKIYESTGDWVALADPKSVFIGYAGLLGLDVKKFTSDIDSSDVKKKVQSDMNDGKVINLSETPTFYIDGVKIKNLTGTYAGLKEAVSTELSKK